MGTRCRHGDHDHRRDRRHALAAPPEPAVHQHHHHRGRHRGAIAMPNYLETLLSHGQLTGWDPAGTTASPSPPSLSPSPTLHRDRRVGHPLQLVFKIGTDPRLGAASRLHVGLWSLLPPPSPLPTLLAAATLPFLFDSTFTIYGGNLFSTLAGEYSFSFSLSLAILFLGLFACAVREGGYRGWAAVVLAGCVLSHSSPACTHWAAPSSSPSSNSCLPAGASPTRRLRSARATRDGSDVPRAHRVVGRLDRAHRPPALRWWLVPFGLEHAYTTSMGYRTSKGGAVLPRGRHLGTGRSPGWAPSPPSSCAAASASR